MHQKRLEDLPLGLIVPNRFQPRIHFDDDKIESLAKSIIRYGVLEPIIVRPINGKFEIIAGERRFKASKIAGKATIPAVIVEFDDKESIELALLENVQRQELTAIEEAIAYRRILDMGYITQEELAKKTGKSQPTIANKMRLLMLDDVTQEALINHKISERHARSLLKLVGTGKELEMLNRIIKERLTVRETDNEIAIILGKKEVPKKDKINVSKTDSFFVTNNELVNNVDVNAKSVDRGPVFVAEKTKEEKESDLGFDEIEKIINQNDITKEEEGEYMDIEKLMQEAQDINAEEKPKNMNDFITTTAPYDNILGTTTEMPVENNTVENTIVNNQNLVDDHNKFINVVPPMMPEQPTTTEVVTPQESTVTFDSVFNSVFETPVTAEVPAEPVLEQVPVADSTISTNDPIMPIVEPVLESANEELPAANTESYVLPEIKVEEPIVENGPLFNEPVVEMPMESIPNPIIKQDGFSLDPVSTTPVAETEEMEIPEFTSTIAESAPNFEIPSPVIPNIEATDATQSVEPDTSFDSIESLSFEEPVMIQNVMESAPSAEESPVYEMPATTIEPVMPAVDVNTLEKAKEIINNCSEQLRQMGFNITTNELDLGSIYQMTFNIIK